MINILNTIATMLIAVALATLTSCSNTKEVETTETIDIEVRLYKGRVQAETESYRAGDSLLINLRRSHYSYGVKYQLMLSRKIYSDTLIDDTLRHSQIWINFTDGTNDYFEEKVFISSRGFEALILDIEPATYDGKKIEKVVVWEAYVGKDRRWTLNIDTPTPIGEVLEDMLDACSKMRETQNKYK